MQVGLAFTKRREILVVYLEEIELPLIDQIVNEGIGCALETYLIALMFHLVVESAQISIGGRG